MFNQGVENWAQAKSGWSLSDSSISDAASVLRAMLLRLPDNSLGTQVQELDVSAPIIFNL